MLQRDDADPGDTEEREVEVVHGAYHRLRLVRRPVVDADAPIRRRVDRGGRKAGERRRAVVAGEHARPLAEHGALDVEETDGNRETPFGGRPSPAEVFEEAREESIASGSGRRAAVAIGEVCRATIEDAVEPLRVAPEVHEPDEARHTGAA